jgi:hypothetical protein
MFKGGSNGGPSGDPQEEGGNGNSGKLVISFRFSSFPKYFIFKNSLNLLHG